MWELSGKACAKCSETRYHLTARPPEGEQGCVPACVRVSVRVRVHGFHAFRTPPRMLSCAHLGGFCGSWARRVRILIVGDETH